MHSTEMYAFIDYEHMDFHRIFIWLSDFVFSQTYVISS